MSKHQILFLIALAAAWHAPAAFAQHAPPGFRDEFLAHFASSSDKLLALAQAVPEAQYTWRPGEGVMSIAQVYTHIARYNYYYPASSLGISAPEGMDLPGLEQITDKAQVIDLLRRSAEHVRSAVAQMPESTLNERTELYGRDVAGWAVLLQLLAHMNEHVGQSIAYARMNGIVPPWSR